jgi:hypothetical protein
MPSPPVRLLDKDRHPRYYRLLWLEFPSIMTSTNATSSRCLAMKPTFMNRNGNILPNRQGSGPDFMNMTWQLQGYNGEYQTGSWLAACAYLSFPAIPVPLHPPVSSTNSLHIDCSRNVFQSSSINANHQLDNEWVIGHKRKRGRPPKPKELDLEDDRKGLVQSSASCKIPTESRLNGKPEDDLQRRRKE